MNIDAELLKQELQRMKYADWVISGICEVIDKQPATDKEPEIIYECLIPLNPRTKKNSQQIVTNGRTKRPIIIQGKKYNEYAVDCGYYLKKVPVPINEPVNIRCIFYRDTERQCDLTNLLEAIDDILIKYKIIKDDNFKIIRTHDGSTVYVDRDYPRTEIYIERATK